MKLNAKTGIDLIKKAFSPEDAVEKFFGASSTTGLFGTETPSDIGSSAEWLKNYHTNPRLTSVNKIATDNGVADFGIYTDASGEKQRVVGHPLEEEINNHTVPMFFALWTAYRLMSGVVYIAYDLENGEPVNLKLFAEHHYMGEEGNYKKFTYGTEILKYHKTQVIKDLDLDLVSPYTDGKGRMASIAEEIELDTWIVRYLKNFYINSAQPGMFIIPRGETMPDSEDLARLADVLRTTHKGIGNAGKTAVLSFNADIATVPSNHKDLELLETRKALRDAGIQHIGIPPEIMGIVENSNKATVVAAEHIYAKQVRMPILRHFEDIINSKILPLYAGSEEYYFEFNDILPDDEEMQMKQAKEGREAGTITINEHRAYLGLPSLVGDEGNRLVGSESGEPVEVSTGEVGYTQVDYRDVKARKLALEISKGKTEDLDTQVVIIEEDS